MLEGAAAARAAGAGNPRRDFGCAALLSRGKVLSLSFQGMALLLAGAGGSALWRTAVATVRPKNCCCFFTIVIKKIELFLLPTGGCCDAVGGGDDPAGDGRRGAGHGLRPCAGHNGAAAALALGVGGSRREKAAAAASARSEAARNSWTARTQITKC